MLQKTFPLFFFCLICGLILWPTAAQSDLLIRRITVTADTVFNVNAAVSGDAGVVVFESSADLALVGGEVGVRTIAAAIRNETPSYIQIARSRAPGASLSSDGSVIVFASFEDLVGKNPDRNSEIFLYELGFLTQVTETIAETTATRLSEGNFQPTISTDGRKIAFSSNRNLTGENSDLNWEVFLFDPVSRNLTQVTSMANSPGILHAQISGDGSRIAYVHSQAGLNTLFLHTLSSDTTKPIAAGVHSSSFSGRAISNDGNRFVYVGETGPEQTQVFLFDAEAGMTRQITELSARADDVPLNPTISGDGKRIAFATRRNVVGGNSDRSVELYLHDIPTGLTEKLTTAPAKATAEVVSSLNTDGSLVVFNFPRVISGEVSDDRLANNPEIYSIPIRERPLFGELELLNGASMGKEPESIKAVAPGSILLAKGTALADFPLQSIAHEATLPQSLAGTRVTVNDVSAELLYASPNQVSFLVPSHTAMGTAEVVVRNRDDYPARGSIQIVSAAPGIFTTSGDGSGAAIVIDATSQATAPLDPTDGGLRIILFGTGVQKAANVKATIDGRHLSVERVISTSEVKGMDEIHLLVPSNMRGLGTGTFSLEADGRESNRATITLGGSALRDIMINELLADPPDGIAGDANRDGLRDSAQDEFVELVNTTECDLDFSGYELLTRSLSSSNDIVRHRFAAGTVVSAGTSLVIFGGGNPNPIDPEFGRSQIYKASTGSLSLGNSGSVVMLRNAAGESAAFQSYGGDTGLRGDQNQSLTRNPDVTGAFVQHQTASAGVLFSPGRRADGELFLPRPPVTEILVRPGAAVLAVGEEVRFTAVALDSNGAEMSGVLFTWTSTNDSIVSVQRDGVARALASGAAQVKASARGVQSLGSSVDVPTPTPIPTPTPLPSPSVTPSPTPTPIPSPTGSPSPTPTVTPSPSPQASPSPSPPGSPLPIVISEFRTRGPSGASDEFVELYNNSDAPVEISGWRIRASSNLGSVSTRMTISAGVFIPARGHFLAVNSPGTANGYSGPVPGDQIYTSGIANDGGIALTLADNTIVDQVGLSAGSAFKEGAHLAPLTGDLDQSYERRPGGAFGSTQDSGENIADFHLLTPSGPENLNAPPAPNPNPAPTPSPSPTPIPSPSTSPTPTPTPVPSPSPSPTPPATPDIVISQIYGGGGNSGAVFQHDFIEIFNAGSVAASLDGWSVQYSSATGTTWSVTMLNPISLGPGQYYLIQQASGGSNGAPLPVPDVIGTIAMAATAGKVALVNSTKALSGSCPNSNTIVDLVGYGGTASCFREAATASPSNSNSAQRRNGGCTNSQNNAADFMVAPANPRNSTSAANICEVSAARELPLRLLKFVALRVVSCASAP